MQLWLLEGNDGMLSVLVSIITAVSFRWPKRCGALLNMDLLCVLLGIPDGDCWLVPRWVLVVILHLL